MPYPNFDDKLDDYQSFVEHTSFFPKDQAITYTALAMVGEAGEVANEVKKYIRDDGSVMTSGRRSAILDESGDVLWYLTALLLSLGYTLTDAINHNTVKLTERRARG